MSNAWRVFTITAVATGATAIGWMLAVKLLRDGRPAEGAVAGGRETSGAGARRERSRSVEIDALDAEQQELMMRELAGLL